MISNQYTYNDIKKPVKRKEMLSNALSSIGTQSGGFGEFNEQARVLTLRGAEDILDELQVNAGLNLEKLFKICPTLKALLNNTSPREEKQPQGDSHKQQDLLGE